ncbi:MAG: DUF4258 domain-containing protein [Terriglobia bacterium]
MDVRWSAEKNELLRRERGVCFEDVAELIRTGEELDIIPHPSRPNQRIMVVRINGYVHAVPFVEDADGLFLKTIYPSRDLNEQYGGEG